jgi:pimeloyl-ACP methyl ester carboxylesterase
MHGRDRVSPPARGRVDDGAGGVRLTRRRALSCGLAAVIGGAFAGLELVAHGVLPGRQTLDEIEGACSISRPPETFAAPGPSYSGQFFSRARRRSVGYTIAYPPGHGPGSELPLIIALHGFGGTHRGVFSGLTAAQALALRLDTGVPAPMALVAADGGGGYWNTHPGDDPMGMVVDELVPMCQRQGLGRPPHRVATYGISMGGYGALLIAERHPRLIAAVAAISPAVWTSYAQARAANPGAYASAADFEADDVVTHTGALARIPVRVASGSDDPFHPGVVALARALPASAAVHISAGCHDGSFFASQQPASLAFLAAHLT